MVHKLSGGLYALIDDGLRPDISMLEKVRAVLQAPIPFLQLRLKKTTDREALALIATAKALRVETQIIINDRVDLALVGQADGVHLGQEDLPVAAARQLLGAEAVIGATVRSLEDIRRAQQAGADYVGLGPIFSTTTKVVGHLPLGIDALTTICAESPLPVAAIAGIDLSNIGAMRKAGARWAVVASDLFRGDDVLSRAFALHRAFFEQR